MNRVVPLLLCAVCIPLRASELSSGYTHFFNLEYAEAIRDFEKAAADAPDEPETHNHLAQAILYRELFRAGALETELVSRNNAFLRRAASNPTPENRKRFEGEIAKSMSLAQAVLDHDKNDAHALYALGVAYGLRANYRFLIEHSWTDALRDATTARKLHGRVLAVDPGNVDAKLLEGVHDYLLGSLPWHYKVLGFFAGMKGDRKGGIETLEQVAQRGDANRYDAKILLAGIYRREEQSAKALVLLDELIAKFPRNYLLRLEQAMMHQDLGENEQAVACLDRIEKLKRSKSVSVRDLPLEKIYYYRGTVLFWSQQEDKALGQFQRVAAKIDEVDLNSAVLTWMRIGQIRDLRGERKEALSAYENAVSLAPDSGPGKESRDYMQSPFKRASYVRVMEPARPQADTVANRHHQGATTP